MISTKRQINVFNCGFVGLEETLGSDLTVVNSARVSYDSRSESLESSDVGLIRFLMRNRHGSPFEHAVLTFHIKCPIFVAREWFRHRIGSFNEVSGRYTELKEEFYTPAVADVRAQVGRPGHYEYERVDEPLGRLASETIEESMKESFRRYRTLLQIGIAKELARSVLPLGTYTQFYWTVNARSLMNFLSLRTADDAQYEIREFAFAAEDLWCQIMPHTYDAWNELGRVSV